jgi:long-chain acyl-CoA synthetase
VDLQAEIEQKFGVSLNDEDLQTIHTREDLNKLVSRGSSLTPPTPHRYWKFPWNPLIQMARVAFIELLALPILRFLAKPRIGRQPEQWPTGPSLIICNHITSYDAPFVLFALPGRIRQHVAIAMSGEMLLDYRSGKTHLLSPIAYWLITVLFNVFPLPRSTGFKDSFKHAGDAVDHGYSVLVFPEGHRSDDGRPQTFRAGSGLLWKELGVPVIPVRIDGLGELKTHPDKRWFRSGSVTVQVGEPLMLDHTASVEQLTEQMRRAVFEDLI